MKHDEIAVLLEVSEPTIRSPAS